MSTTTVAGCKFSAQTAAVLQHAVANGFRVEADTSPKAKANQVIVYPANKDNRPVKVQEIRAKFNPAHTDNIYRQLVNAGMPPLPGYKGSGTTVTDLPDEMTDDEVLANLPPGAVALDFRDGAENRVLTGDNVLQDREKSIVVLREVVGGLVSQMGLGDAEAELAAVLASNAVQWARAYSPDRLGAAAATVAAQRVEADLQEALRMAQAAEAKVTRLTAAVARAEEKERQARTDCGAALRRAETAETEAGELRAALAPLRALLSKVD